MIVSFFFQNYHILMSNYFFKMAYMFETPGTTLESSLQDTVQAYVADAGQVIVHGFCRAVAGGCTIRISPSTTHLYDCHSGHRSELILFERISAFPKWIYIPPNTDYGFTLIFSGLPKSCKFFDLIEICPQGRGFRLLNITRNDMDVYYLDFTWASD